MLTYIVRASYLPIGNAYELQDDDPHQPQMASKVKVAGSRRHVISLSRGPNGP